MLRSHVHTIAPSALCPFHVDAIQYVPAHPHARGLTLVFLHATNTHKESFEPALRHLLRAPRLRIRDVWCIENPNHGSSALKNRTLLDTPAYRDTWTAKEYARAVHAFLASTAHGTDFRTRTLVGLAQSAAAAPLLLLQRAPPHPALRFEGLVFMEGAILPPGTRATNVLCGLFGNWARSKPSTWRSRADARAQLAATAFRRWDPRAVELFVKHAIRAVEGSTNVTLCSSTRQEAAYYLAPTADLVDAPTEIFVQLAQDDQLPMHVIVCFNDEYKGKGTEMKQFQVDHVARTSAGSAQIVEGGHMFPQTEPVLCAGAVAQAIERIQLRESRASSRL